MRSLAILILAAGAPAQSHKVQLFNADIFGTATSAPVRLLLDKTDKAEVEPYVIWTDIRCGRYIGASAFYRKPVTAQDLRDALNEQYPGSALDKKKNSDLTLWRVESRGFAIQLVDKGEDGIDVIYLHFAPHTDVWKNIMKTQGFKEAADTIPDADCSEWDGVLGQDRAK